MFQFCSSTEPVVFEPQPQRAVLSNSRQQGAAALLSPSVGAWHSSP